MTYILYECIYVKNRHIKTNSIIMLFICYCSVRRWQQRDQQRPGQRTTTQRVRARAGAGTPARHGHQAKDHRDTTGQSCSLLLSPAARLAQTEKVWQRVIAQRIHACAGVGIPARHGQKVIEIFQVGHIICSALYTVSDKKTSPKRVIINCLLPYITFNLFNCMGLVVAK